MSKRHSMPHLTDNNAYISGVHTAGEGHRQFCTYRSLSQTVAIFR